MIVWLTENFIAFWQWAWPWITWGNDFLRGVVAYGTFIGVMYTAWGFWRARGKVTIAVTNGDDPEAPERVIAKVPRSFVSRAEIMGLVGQAAGQDRVDFSRFVFDYRPRKKVVVALPGESFRRVTDALYGARAAAFPAGSPSIQAVLRGPRAGAPAVAEDREISKAETGKH